MDCSWSYYFIVKSRLLCGGRVGMLLESKLLKLQCKVHTVSDGLGAM